MLSSFKSLARRWLRSPDPEKFLQSDHLPISLLSLDGDQEQAYNAISNVVLQIKNAAASLKEKLLAGGEPEGDDVWLLRNLPVYFAGMSTVNGTVSFGFQWNVGQNMTGAAYQQVSNAGNINKRLTMNNTLANNTSGGSDEVFSFQQGITAGSSATFNLQAMTDLLLRTSISIARFKPYATRLLSATDDATISPAPNTTSTCLVTNNGNISIPNALDFGSPGTGLLVAVVVFANNAINTITLNTAGSGYPPNMSFMAALNQVNSSGGVVQVTTNTAGIPTAVSLAQAGAGYTNATLNTTIVGSYMLNTGDAHVHVDASANGTPVDSLHKNIQVINNDAAHAITVELDFFGATT